MFWRFTTLLLLLLGVFLVGGGAFLLTFATDTPAPGLIVLALGALALYLAFRNPRQSVRDPARRGGTSDAFEMTERDRRHIDYDFERRARGEHDAFTTDDR